MQAEKNLEEQRQPKQELQTCLTVPKGQSMDAMLSQLTGYSRQRGCIPIPIDFFTKVLPTLSEAELRVYLYQLFRTLGFGKQSDSIANGQFLNGIVDKQGEFIDQGCGLKSVKSIRKATHSLAQKGLVKRSRRLSHHTGDQPNQFTLNLTMSPTRKPEVAERKCMGEGIEVAPQNASTKRKIQRCMNKRVMKSIRSGQQIKSPSRKSQPKRFMDSDHVDYLIDQMEQVTGDAHSRGAFAQVAMSVAEGKIMELLAILKDRGNIRNKGAWFLTTSRKHVENTMSRRRSHDCEHSESKRSHGPIPQSVSLKELLWSKKRALAQKLGLPQEVRSGVAQSGELTANRVRVPSVFGYGYVASLSPP